jgi:hypothetical protein
MIGRRRTRDHTERRAACSGSVCWIMEYAAISDGQGGTVDGRGADLGSVLP